MSDSNAQVNSAEDHPENVLDGHLDKDVEVELTDDTLDDDDDLEADDLFEEVVSDDDDADDDGLTTVLADDLDSVEDDDADDGDELVDDDEVDKDENSVSGDDEDDDELDDELDELLEEDEEVQPLDEDDGKKAPKPRRKVELVSDDEFTCRSCFLVKKPSQLADRDAMLCFDCV